jgi:hypothetical protein
MEEWKGGRVGLEHRMHRTSSYARSWEAPGPSAPPNPVGQRFSCGDCKGLQPSKAITAIGALKRALEGAGPSAPLNPLGQCFCSRRCKGPLQTNNGNPFSYELEGRRLGRPLEFGQFPSRFRQSDGRGSPVPHCGAGVPARVQVFRAPQGRSKRVTPEEISPKAALTAARDRSPPGQKRPLEL